MCHRKGGLKGIGVSGSGYNEVLALKVLNVVDHVEQRRRSEFPEPVSASPAVAAAPLFQACVRACICTCRGESGKLHSTGVVYAGVDQYIHGDRCFSLWYLLVTIPTTGCTYALM